VRAAPGGGHGGAPGAHQQAQLEGRRKDHQGGVWRAARQHRAPHARREPGPPVDAGDGGLYSFTTIL
jgi:hypothetical protein